MADVTPQPSPPSGRVVYDRILVPLDGSDEAEAALRYAALLPARELVLLHVEHEDEIFVPEWIFDEDADPDVHTVRAELDQLAARLRAEGRAVEVVTEIGDVAEQIISSALNTDLIVMATHGRGAAGRLLFGSVADRVVRHGMTPTLLLRAGAHTKAPRLPRRVVVTLDGSEEAEQALPQAERLARAIGIPILLLRAVGFDEVRVTLRRKRKPGEPPFVQSPDLYEQARIETVEEATRYLDAVAGRLRSEGLEVDRKVVEGAPAFCLMWEMGEDDIAVVTTHGTSGYKRWSIGSVAEKLVREAPCPVLLQRIPQEARRG